MGQKVHPLGFRVGITKKHQSQWFARFNKYKYSQSILEDHMIRGTLSKLFPELLNPLLNNSKGNISKKRDEEISITPRITQIKIERGLIPYEIGIQIHAENCELLKLAIDNLKVKRELIAKLQKARRYFLNLKLKLKDLTNNSETAQSLGMPDLGNQNVSSNYVVPKASAMLLRNKEQNKSFRLIKTKVIRSKKLPSFGRISRDIISKNDYALAKNKKFGKFSFKLSKQEARRLKLIKKRLKKRQLIRNSYRQLILTGLFLRKKGNKIVQTLRLSRKKFEIRSQNAYRKSNNGIELRSSERKTNYAVRNTLLTSTTFNSKTSNVGDDNMKDRKKLSLKNTFGSRIKKKFVTLFIQKMNKKFLLHLKELLTNFNLEVSRQGTKPHNIQGITNNSLFLPLGFSKQWSLNRLNSLKNEPLYKLNKMIIVLEQKLLVKLDSLRKEFIAFGSISSQSSETLGYFQILNFLKNLKELVNKLKREQKLQLVVPFYRSWSHEGNGELRSTPQYSVGQRVRSASQSLRNGDPSTSTTVVRGEMGNKQLLNLGNTIQNFEFKGSKGSIGNLNLRSLQGKESLVLDKTFGLHTLVQKKLNNIENECRKVKLIEYIKDIVKKHRTQNIYLYLSTIADAAKDLRKIKKFTKRHADFLFGLNLKSSTFMLSREAKIDGSQIIEKEATQIATSDCVLRSTVPSESSRNEYSVEKINERVNKVLEKTSKKINFVKTLQDIFLEQIEKQRTMCLENINLTPKLSIKFYSVNKKTIEQKASVVSESVVDALEKRKAFRKVIKDAKETLMRTSGVKGVKIQVAGRLNGAEIARTEWVRAGRVPLQTLRANLDYSYRTANTIYGIIGVRVWIFKGYTKLLTK